MRGSKKISTIKEKFSYVILNYVLESMSQVNLMKIYFCLKGLAL